MPNVDLRTGKITGCKKGSKEWHHEKAHLIYNSSEFGIKNNYLAGLYQLLAITFIVLAWHSIWIWFFAFAAILMMWYYFFYEEWWCSIYAMKKTTDSH